MTTQEKQASHSPRLRYEQWSARLMVRREQQRIEKREKHLTKLAETHLDPILAAVNTKLWHNHGYIWSKFENNFVGWRVPMVIVRQVCGQFQEEQLDNGRRWHFGEEIGLRLDENGEVRVVLPESEDKRTEFAYRTANINQEGWQELVEMQLLEATAQGRHRWTRHH